MAKVIDSKSRRREENIHHSTFNANRQSRQQSHAPWTLSVQYSSSTISLETRWEPLYEANHSRKSAPFKCRGAENRRGNPSIDYFSAPLCDLCVFAFNDLVRSGGSGRGGSGIMVFSPRGQGARREGRHSSEVPRGRRAAPAAPRGRRIPPSPSCTSKSARAATRSLRASRSCSTPKAAWSDSRRNTGLRPLRAARPPRPPRSGRNQ